MVAGQFCNSLMGYGCLQAYTDVTRMNIFLSLVQLLEPNAVTQQGVANMNMNTNIVNIPSTNL